MLCDFLKEWVVKDYFTPNIKAEVILDTLLTPHIPEILKSQHPDIDAVFITKEMSISEGKESGEEEGEGEKPEEEPGDNRGPKIDYVLADKNRDRVYLVELKTTDSSIEDKQLNFYTALADREQNFGQALGGRLLAILAKSFPTVRWDPKEGDGALEKAWDAIWEKRRQYDPEGRNPKESNSCADMAMDLIRVKGWATRSNLRSRKYVYTLGQLLDFLRDECGGKGLWERPVELIYLFPRIPEDRTPYGEKIRLAAFVPYFEAQEKDAPLASIVREIYCRGNPDG